MKECIHQKQLRKSKGTLQFVSLGKVMDWIDCMFLQEEKKKKKETYIHKWKGMVKDIIQQVCRIAEKKQNWASMWHSDPW